MAALTDTGLATDTIDEVRTEMEQDFRDTFHASLPLGDETILGHLIGIVAEQAGLGQERLQQVYSAGDKDKATGHALDVLCLLTGTVKQGNTPSEATITLCGDPGTTVNAGFVVRTASTAVRFDTIADVALTGLDAWTASTLYALDDRVTANAHCYRCTTPGTSASSGTGPDTTTPDPDNTVRWRYIGDGTAAGDAIADAEITGPQFAAADDLRDIQTPVVGVNTARNFLDAELGTDEWDDETLRLVQTLEVASGGQQTQPSLAAKLRALKNVTSVRVFNNRTDSINADGLPPHSFEALVLGGDQQTIVDLIGDQRPDGVATYGLTSGTYTDAEGNSDLIYYTVPADVNVFILIVLNYDATLYPLDGDNQVKVALASRAEVVGSDVDPTAVGSAAFAVSGVRGVHTSIYLSAIGYPSLPGTPIGWLPTHLYGPGSVVTNDGGRYYTARSGGGGTSGSTGPTGVGSNIIDGSVHWDYIGQTITVDSRHIARFDTTRINVKSFAVTP
jgi:hypothetical protein